MFLGMDFLKVFIVLVSVSLITGDIPRRAKTSYYKDGHFILGGLIPVYGYLHDDCFWLRTTSIQEAELMAYAIDQINSRSDLLPNVTLGFDIRPYCNDESVVTSVALSMAGAGGKTCQDTAGKTSKFIGIVGPGTSVTSVATAIATTVHQIPVISYGGSSMELSDKSRFPYFMRTWPPGTLQAAAIVDILLRFEWTYVGLMYSRNTYGIHGAQEIETLAEHNNICLAYSVPLSQSTDEHEVNGIVEKLLGFNMAKVIIFFVHPPRSGYDVLKALIKANPDHHGLTIVSSDSFGSVSYMEHQGLANLTRGSIAVRSYYKEVPGFSAYYRSIQVEGRPRSKWLKFLESIEVSKNPNCHEISQCPLNCTLSCNIHYIVDAVYVFSVALDAVLSKECSGSVQCLLDEASGPALLPHLRNASFPGAEGLFTFNAVGDPGAKYQLTMLQFANGSHRETIIGFWDSRSENRNHLNLTMGNLPWPNGETAPPRSVCREVCLPGHILVPSEMKCCYRCQRCPVNAVVFNDTECHVCTDFHWPSVDYTLCEVITPSSLEWTNVLVCFIVGLTILGVALTSCTALGLCYYRQHPLIKATSRELSSVNIIGLLLSCLTVIPLLTNPTNTSCSLTDVMISLSFTLTYAPTVLKVNRIFRIFLEAKTSKKRPKFVSPRQQLMLVSGLIALQITIVVVAAIFSSSIPQRVQPSALKKQVDIFCSFRAGFLASCIYNFVLILTCCYYAFKTRKVPSNYNESKFIAMSVYSTLLLGAAVVLVYTTAVAVMTMKATLCMFMLLNAYLTVACVYLPKLYAVRFVQDLKVIGVQSFNSQAAAGAPHITGSTGGTAVRAWAVHPEAIQPSDTL